MKVNKLLKKYLGFVNVQFYENKKLIAYTSNKDLYSGYPLDRNNYILLNSKVKSYRVLKMADTILFKIDIKKSKSEDKKND